MPGSAQDGPPVGSEAGGLGKGLGLGLGSGLREQRAPLPYLRSRNALKIILDLDEDFGRPRAGRPGWVGLPVPLGRGGAAAGGA